MENEEATELLKKCKPLSEKLERYLSDKVRFPLELNDEDRKAIIGYKEVEIHNLLPLGAVFKPAGFDMAQLERLHKFIFTIKEK